MVGGRLTISTIDLVSIGDDFVSLGSFSFLGYPGRESQVRAALAKAIGTEKANFFFEKVYIKKEHAYKSLRMAITLQQLLEYFFTDADAKFFKSLGLNCLRLPFSYKHFEDDMNPRQLKQEGFAHLDRVIDICARHGIWTVLDLHAVPGWQNGVSSLPYRFPK